MKSVGKARNNGLYRHIRTSKEIIRNLLNDSSKNTKAIPFSEMAFVFTILPLRCIFSVISCLPSA